MGCEARNWIYLTQYRDLWRAYIRKASPLSAMKGQGNVDTRVHSLSATVLGIGGVASPSLDCNYSLESHSTHFVSGSVGPMNNLYTKERRKSPFPPPHVQDRTRGVHP